MGILDKIKKEKVPDELPNLAMDDLNEEISHITNELKKLDSPEEAPSYESLSQKTKKLPGPGLETIPEQVSTESHEENYESQNESYDENSELDLSEKTDEKGFFRDTIKEVTDGLESAENLDEWYRSKFLSEDIVHQMRDYWEKQKPELLLKSIGGEIKKKLMEKSNKLHKLEKEWQDIYFTMLDKEEEIRTNEKELKGLLQDFIEKVKKSKDRKK